MNSALLKLFLQDEELLSHLHSLRSYFFLLDGEFGRNMTSMLFERTYQVACPAELLNFVTLNSILSKALTRPDSNMDRLSFEVKYTPQHFSFSSPHLHDCIMLKYRVAWPLNIIFTDAALQKYDDVSNGSGPILTYSYRAICMFVKPKTCNYKYVYMTSVLSHMFQHLTAIIWEPHCCLKPSL